MGPKPTIKLAILLSVLLLATIVEARGSHHSRGFGHGRRRGHGHGPHGHGHRGSHRHGQSGIHGPKPGGQPEGLVYNYYWQSCPNAEKIIRREVENFVFSDPTLAPALLRMHFHDCFVDGCEGSVLLNSTNTTKAEKDAFPNLSLRGFPIVDAAKAALELQCPLTVSCADILTVLARDSVNLLGGPYYKVPLGRKDGFTSVFANALTLPSPASNIAQLKASFQNKGLTAEDLVVLSGAHTVGFSHCSTISRRLYNFTGHGDTDPTLDPLYAAQLKQVCKQGDTVTKVPMDRGSFLSFDSHYFDEVQKHRGLFPSDNALLNDNQTLSILTSEIQRRGGFGPLSNFPFFAQFPKSMVAMGNVGVLTGIKGQIRSKCSVVNS